MTVYIRRHDHLVVITFAKEVMFSHVSVYFVC